MRRPLLGMAMAAAVMMAGGVAHAAEIKLINVDPPGEGLNDQTPLAPAGGNYGRTIGEQRRLVYQYAADMWGAVLQSDVPIQVQAGFSPLECTEKRKVLGSAGPITAQTLADVEGAVPDTWYVVALANALAGKDLSPDKADIKANFSSSYGLKNPDGSDCAKGSGWYYGFDGNIPEGLTSFLDTVMHELGHGLGFLGLGDVGTGKAFQGKPDIYSTLVIDNASRKGWYELDDAGRKKAIVDEQLVFDGASTVKQAKLLLDEETKLAVSGALVERFDYGLAEFGPKITAFNFSGRVVLADDGVSDPADACDPLPKGSLSGKIAFINRGGPADCGGFEAKAANAQAAGAIAAIIGNVATSNSPDIAPGMKGADEFDATIPVASLALGDADAIREASAHGDIDVAFVRTGALLGADAGDRPKLYAPTELEGGSTFSHFDVSLSPNALMEPAINDSLAANVDLDLTPAAFSDMGWKLNSGSARIDDCDTTIPILEQDGLAVGASIQANASVCLVEADGNRSKYLRCVSDRASELRKATLITGEQFNKVRTCAARVKPERMPE